MTDPQKVDLMDVQTVEHGAGKKASTTIDARVIDDSMMIINMIGDDRVMVVMLNCQ